MVSYDFAGFDEVEFSLMKCLRVLLLIAFLRGISKNSNCKEVIGETS